MNYLLENIIILRIYVSIVISNVCQLHVDKFEYDLHGSVSDVEGATIN